MVRKSVLICYMTSLHKWSIRHSSHDFGWQSSHSVDLAGWQAKMASIEIWIPWCNAHKPHSLHAHQAVVCSDNTLSLGNRIFDHRAEAFRSWRSTIRLRWGSGFEASNALWSVMVTLLSWWCQYVKLKKCLPFTCNLTVCRLKNKVYRHLRRIKKIHDQTHDSNNKIGQCLFRQEQWWPFVDIIRHFKGHPHHYNSE